MPTLPPIDRPKYVSALPLRVSGLVLVLLGLVPVANWLSAGHAVPWWPAAVAEWLRAGTGIVLVAILLAWVLRDRADSVVARASGWLDAPSPRAFAWGIAVFVFLLAAFFAWYCFANSVFTGDELSQRWQAQILLSGHLVAHPELHREFFSTTEVLDAGSQWFSQFPIGGPAILAVGVWFGAPWLVNPALTGFTAYQLYRFASRAFDETTARATTLLFALSPMVLIMSGSEMNHVATLAFVVWAMAQLTTWATASDPRTIRRSAVGIGFALGAAATVRPYDAALAALAIGAFQLATVVRDPQRRASLIGQVVAGAIPTAILLYVNARTTGHPFLFAYDLLNGLSHRPGFHVDPFGKPFTPFRGLIISAGYLMKLNRYLFEWPTPGLLVIVAGLLAIRRATRWDLLLIGLFAAIAGGYACYWFDGFFSGPRFLYTALPACFIFTARAPRVVADRLRRLTPWPAARRAVFFVVPLCVVYAWTVPTGVSSVQLRAFYYHELHGRLKTDVRAEVASARLSNALVFIPESWHARIVARLRALGMRPLPAEGVMDSLDACALQTALDAEDTLPPPSHGDRLRRVVATARSAGVAIPVKDLALEEAIAIVPGSRPTSACLAQASRENLPTIPYSLFLMEQSLDHQGQVGGPVVFARDFGTRDSLLRARFGNRTWYRYRPSTGVHDTTPRFVPVAPGTRRAVGPTPRPAAAPRRPRRER